MNIAGILEHTKLNPASTIKEIEDLCEEALEHNFRGVCVPPSLLKVAKRKLNGTDQKLITVIDYPNGYSHTASKVESIKKAKDAGADSVDVVLNYNAAINGDWAVVQTDAETVVHAAKMIDLEVKIIIELGAYTSKHLGEIVKICQSAGPDFVKTNTGVNNGKVTTPHLKLLRRLLGEKMPIKASGGINNITFAKELIESGANIIGSSSCVDLIK